MRSYLKYLLSTLTILLLSGQFMTAIAQTDIESWEDLANMSLSGNYILTEDLDSSTPGYNDYAGPNANSGSGWEPIGDTDNPFTGTLDGGDNSISGLRINRGTEEFVGLFSAIDGATIQNLTIDDAEVNADGGNEQVANVSILAGQGLNFTIENFTLNGKITATTDFISGNDRIAVSQIGGLVAFVPDVVDNEVTISQLNFDVDVEVTVNRDGADIDEFDAVSIGGLVGKTGENRSDYTNVWTIEDIEATGSFNLDVDGRSEFLSLLFADAISSTGEWNLSNINVDQPRMEVNGNGPTDLGIFGGRLQNSNLNNLTITDGSLIVNSLEDGGGSVRRIRRAALGVGRSGSSWEIENSGVIGNVTINGDNSVSSVGLFFGRTSREYIITDSWAEGNINITAGRDADEVGLFLGSRQNANDWEVTDSHAEGNITISAGRNVDETGIFAGSAGRGWNLTNSWAKGNINITAGLDPDNSSGDVEGIAIFVGESDSGWNVTDSWAEGDIIIENLHRDVEEIAIFTGTTESDWVITNSYARGDITIDTVRDVEDVAIFAGKAVGNWKVENSEAEGDLLITTSEGDVDEVAIFTGDAGIDWEIINSHAKGDVTINAGVEVSEVAVFMGNSNSRWDITDSSAEGDIDITAGTHSSGRVDDIGIFAGNPGGTYNFNNSTARGNIKITNPGDVREVGIFVGDSSLDWSVIDSNAEGDITIESTGGDVYEIGVFVGDQSRNSTFTNTYAKGNIDITADQDIYMIGVYFGIMSTGLTIKNSYAMGDITANAGNELFWIGSFIGLSSPSFNIYTNISNVFSSGDITVKTSDENADFNSIGGFIGYIGDYGDESITIEDVYSYGDIAADGASSVGGLVGTILGSSATISNTYAAGEVIGNADTAGLIGLQEGANSIENSFFDKILNPGMPDEADFGKTTQEMKASDIFTTAGWDFTDTWTTASSEFSKYISYPYLQEINYDEPGAEPEVNPIPGLELLYAGGEGTDEGPYEIETWEHLDNVRLNLDANFILVNDLSPSDDDYDDFASDQADGGNGWVPIGTNSDRFTGTFDGDGHEIEGLYISRSSVSEQGLFGRIHTATISDLHLINAEVRGNTRSGGLVGFATSSSTIQGSSADVDISGPAYIGGLVGQAENSDIIDSYTSGSLSGPGTNWVGQSGGLVGMLLSNSTIINSYSSVNATRAGTRVGGLVGQMDDSEIFDSYATGDINGQGPWNELAGFVGVIFGNSLIQNSYSSGSYSDDRIAGFAGNIEDDSEIRSSFWNESVQDEGTTEEGVGENTSSGTVEVNGLTDSEMQNIFTFYDAGWDFIGETANGTNDIWKWNPNDNSGYPFLNWQDGTNVIPPLLISLTPEDGASGVAVDTEISVTFSLDIEIKDTGKIDLRDDQDNPVAISATTEDEKLIITSDAGDLKNDMEYTVAIENGAVTTIDEAGNRHIEWSFTTTMAAPVADNQRQLVSNATAFVFSGTDFGVTDANYSIKIESVPDKGSLSAEADDVLSIIDINADQLTWEPPDDEHGYGFTTFEFIVVDEYGQESEETYTMTLDLAATSVELTAGKGWRFLTSSSVGDTFEDFLEPIYVQGVPGSNNPGAQETSLYILNQEDYQWELPDGMGEEITRGNGFIVFGFEDDMPSTLSSGENWAPLEDVFEYEGLFFDPDQGEFGESHFLIANPHPISLDFCAFDESSVADYIQIWDPSHNDGDYRTLSCSDGEAEIAPFQAFWIRTLDEQGDPSLSIPEQAYLSVRADEQFNRFKDIANSENSPLKRGDERGVSVLALSVEGESTDDPFSNTTRILFHNEGTEGMDRFDAPKLSPQGLTERWLSFYVLDEQKRGYALRSLPQQIDEQLTIPLAIETTQPGAYTLRWALPEPSHFSGSYYLRDTRTGDLTELNEAQNYRFEIDESIAAKASNSRLKRGDARGMFSTQIPDHESTPRFELILSTERLEDDDNRPNSIILAQNYPNPFNPTTQITYELPQAEHVRLEVYDMTGRQLATLVDGQVSAGSHTVSFDAQNLASGVYIYRLQAGGQLLTRQLTLIK